MRNILYIFISIGFAIIITSCEYKPVGEFERNADENVAPPEIQVLDLNLDNNDSIFLYTGLEVAFRFASTSQNIKNVKFTVDGQETYNASITNGQFYVDYGKINEGNHTLLLEIVTATGSGSIAEHVGAEGFLFSKSWILIVDKSFYSKTTATSFNGFLKLAWPEYRNSDFREYIVTRDKGSYNEVELERSKNHVFIDSSYVGEGASYFVNVSTSDGKTIPWGHPIVKSELPLLSVYASETHQYAIKWGKFKYYNAVRSFNLAQSFNNGFTYTQLKSTNVYSDSAMIIPNAYLGDNLYFLLSIVPRGNNIMYNPDNHLMFEIKLETYTGFKFISRDTRIEEIFQVSSSEFVYSDRCSSLYRYSVSTKNSVDYMTYQPLTCSGCLFIGLAVSPAGKYLTSLHHLCDGNAMLIPTDNLNNYSLHNLTSITLSSPLYVSDIGTAIANTTSAGFYIYDLKTNLALAHYNKAGFQSKGISISPGGNYIFMTDDSLRMVNLNGTTFSNSWSDAKDNLPEYFGFDSSNPEQFAEWNGNVLSVKRCSNFSTIYEFPLTDSMIMNIDYFNRKILTYTPGTPGHLYIRDYSNGQLLSTIPVNLEIVEWNKLFFLINNTIVCTNGFMDFY